MCIVFLRVNVLLNRHMSPDFQSVASKRAKVNTPTGKRRRPSIQLANEVVILKEENVRVCFSMAKDVGVAQNGPVNKKNKRRLFDSQDHIT